MKTCPFCTQELEDTAAECGRCGKLLGSRPGSVGDGRVLDRDRPWYFRTTTVVIAHLCVLGLALPLVWFNPYYSPRKKIITTIIVGAVTWIAVAQFVQSLQILDEYYKLMF